MSAMLIRKSGWKWSVNEAKDPCLFQSNLIAVTFMSPEPCKKLGQYFPM